MDVETWTWGSVKGFSDDLSGPLGPLLQRVNAAVDAVQPGDTRERVESLLGPADEIRTDGPDPSSPLQGLMEGVAGGSTMVAYGSKGVVDAVLVYRDPYRKRRRYLVVIHGGVVVRVQHETDSLLAAET